MNTLNQQWFAKLLVCLTLSIFSYSSFANSEFCSISCNGQINHSLSSTGVSVITPSMMGATSDCAGPLEVHIMDTNGTDIGDEVNCSHVGQTLMVSVIHIASGVNCWGSILVEDKYKPTITCTDIMIPCNADTDPASTGYPVTSDNCGIQGNPTYSDVEVDLDCSDLLFVARIERTWTVVDVNGNSQSCVQNIFLEKADISQSNFPPDTILDCSTTNLDPSLLGEPMINGIVIGGYCDLKFTHTDGPIFDMCGGGYKFFRTWTIIDCCTNSILSDDQLIELRDTTPPMITCPADLTVSTTSNDCTGSLILPDPTVTDDCSNFSITHDFNFPLVGNAHTNIPVGTHQVTYTATDDCGNSSACTFNITIKDQVSPVAVCDNPTTVSIGNDGTAKVFAVSFDKASTDNCGIDTMMIRKMDDTDFSECLTFDCSEVGDTVMVVLRVVDECGNYNECMVEAIIDDKLSPDITCPPDTILQCTDYENFVATTPSISDNCGLDTMYFADDSTGFDLCSKTGVILREWFVQDLGGLLDSCIQTITVVDNTTLTFIYPPDTTISCTSSTDPTFTGVATVMGGCRSIAISKEDTPLEMDICNRKILRKWRFYDNCADTFLLADSIQKIIITDLENPMITCDSVEENDDFDFCQVFVFNEATAIDSCSGIDTIFNDSPFQQNNLGYSATGTYPIGEHTVTYTAIDSCGNQATCVSVIKVNDITPPDIFCAGVIVIGVTPTMPAVFDINDYIPTRFSGVDNCSPPVDITLNQSSLDMDTVECSDIPSPFLTDEIQVLFSDTAGNVNYDCTPILRYICIGGLALAGVIENEEHDMMEDVAVKISDGDNAMMSYPLQGIYSQDSLNSGMDYTITPEKNIDPLNGVTTYDLVLIQKHILGIQILDSPYKIIAADANRSGGVTGMDIIALRSLILHMIDELPNNTSWRFVDSHFEFNNPIDPFSDDFPESMNCLNLTESILDINFMAIKVGDVNSTALVNYVANADTRNDGPMIDFMATNFFLEKGKTYSIPIFAKQLEELQGFQFTLEFNPTEIEFLEIKNGWLKKENFGFRYASEGAITCSWNRKNNELLNGETPLFYFDIKAKSDGFLENILQLNSKYTSAEAYNIKNKIHGINFQFQKNGLDLYPDLVEPQLFQNQPNPFSASSEIKFFTPHYTIFELQIIDISGKVIKTYHHENPGGIRKIFIDRSIFPASGIYWYKLITPTFSDTKKMLIVD